MAASDDGETLVDDSSHRAVAPPGGFEVSAVDGTRGRYRHAEHLGRGGMGDVVLVEDARIGRRVALKKLKADVGGDVVLQHRFAREAKIQAQLEHPAIVPVYDVGMDEDGSVFFTMKRIRGKSLASVIRELSRGDESAREQFTKRRLLAAFAQVCLAVHYAHEHGVVHRDIKPSNIMLGAYGEVYLLDWGIAKLIDETDAPGGRTILQNDRGAAQTQLGDVIGTPGYMSPEQARGDSALVGPAADVYSLGAILFEILTLTPLVPREAVSSQPAEEHSSVCARPSVRAPGAKVPPQLEALCVAATSEEIGARPASARAVHDAIEAYLDGDRDLELRRALSRKHAEQAVEAAAAPSSGAEERRDALRGLGQALALDPMNRVALQTLVDLLRRPPERLPKEVDEAKEQVTRDLLRRAGIVGAVWYFLAFAATFALRTQHVLDESSLHGMEIAWFAAALAGVVTAKRPSYTAMLVMFVLSVWCHVWALRSVMGPFAVVPGSLALHGVLYSLARLRQVRIFVLVGVCAAWTVSVFGESWGWLPATTQFTPTGMVVSWSLVELSPSFARAFLYVTVLGLIALPAVVAGLLRAAQGRADDRTRLLMWQLHQLLPDAARAEP